MDSLFKDDHYKILETFIPHDCPSNGQVVLVTGYPGSGKSTLIRQIAKENKAAIIDTDQILFELKAYKKNSPKAYKDYVKKNFKKFNNLMDSIIPVAEALATILLIGCVLRKYAIVCQSFSMTSDVLYFQQHDYKDIEVILVNTDLKTSYNRAKIREKTSKLPINDFSYQNLFYSLYPDFIKLCSKIPLFLSKKLGVNGHYGNVNCSVYNNLDDKSFKKLEEWAVGVDNYGHLEVIQL